MNTDLETVGDDPRNRCIHQLFEEQVQRTPDSVAVLFGEERISYRELDEKANRLAVRLNTLGIGPETIVAACLERSPELLIAMIAILKAGGAYMPLDPAWPAERLSSVLEESAPPLILTRNELADRFDSAKADLLFMENPAGTVVQDLAESPSPPVSPGNLAYVIYTSGSTGRPKGVAMEHGAACNFLHWSRTRFPMDENDVFLQTMQPTFDVSIFEVFTTLFSGAALLMIKPGGQREPDYLAELISSRGATVANFVPSTLRMLADERFIGSLRNLRRVFCGAEAMPPDLMLRLLGSSSMELINLYGPTEAAIYCMAWICNQETGDRNPPIGKPISNTRVLILGPDGNRLPAGTPGELFLGGACLARGYLRRPDLTAERFVPDPFSPESGERLYRTGDLASWNEDGTVAFHGRIDDQIKLRGFRIEPEEIQKVLRSYPAIRQSLVICREDVPGDQQLVAYCVPENGEHIPSASELRRLLGSTVPEYMIPSAFVEIESLPLTPNGKIDRKVLPAPGHSCSRDETAFHPARSCMEISLAEIWGSVLGISDPGIHDNFFELGGHSLLALSLSARISASMKVELSLRRIFDHPTIAGQASLITEMLADGMTLENAPTLPAEKSLPNGHPLSYAQQRLWFLEQLEGNSTAYNMPYAWRIRGRLVPEALQKTLEELVKGHESLRTHFGISGGEPVRIVATACALELPLSDCSGLCGVCKEEEITRIIAAEAARPFNLEKDLMLRGGLIRLDTSDHVLMITLHHIAADAWSMSILLRDLDKLYQAYCHGDPPDPIQPAPQHFDYGAWQGEILAQGRLQRHLDFWREELRGVMSLELPSDRPRAPESTRLAGKQDLEVGPELLERLEAMSRREGVTLQMTLLAAFQVLLSRYSTQEDLVVGIPVAGRHHVGLENQVGFFVNTLPIRANLSGNPKFRDFLQKVRNVCLNALDHQDLPFEKLVEETRPERRGNHAPLFQVFFQLQNKPEDKLKLGDLVIEVLPQTIHRVRCDLELDLFRDMGSIRGSLRYSTDLFDSWRIERMGSHYLTLLKGIADNTNQPVGTLPLLTRAESRELLATWSKTKAEHSTGLCVHQLFEEQVRRTPDAIAVEFGKQTLSYAELDARANQLARLLKKSGVVHGMLVGICLERSTELVIAMIAVLKAGGAYVPLDPTHPKERLVMILGESSVPVTLSQDSLSRQFVEYPGVLLRMDDPKLDWETLSALPLGIPSTSDNTAYVIHTSGSTGKPKGVAIPHRGVSRLVINPDYVRLDADETILQLAPAAFDAATFEVWGALLNGGRLVIFPPHTPELKELGEFLIKKEITTLWLTAALFHQMVESEMESLLAVRQILSGGDVLSPTHVRRLLARLPSGHVLINGYGPTENTTFSTCHRMDCESVIGTQVPIGKPINGTQVYILDRHDRPLPVGIPGELLLGGQGLADSYINSPELTAEKFLPNPVPDAPSSRLYRTGDLASWNPDGTIAFHGRMDHQIKLRGFRIEPGEIEEALLRISPVRQALVLCREDNPGRKELAAYCVTHPGEPLPPPKELRRQLASWLPEHMIPSAFIQMERFALAPNGKIDRKLLPRPETSATGADGTPITRPRDLLEHRLIDLWKKSLGRAHLGVHDNFFELGGHSLSAAILSSQIEKLTGKRLPIAAFFQTQTVSELGAYLQKQQGELPWSSVVPMQPHGTRTPLFVLHGMGGDVFAHVHWTREFSPERPVYGIQAVGLDGKQPRHTSIEAMAEHYARQIRGAYPSGPYHLAGYSMGGWVAYAVAGQLLKEGGDIGMLAMLDTAAATRLDLRECLAMASSFLSGRLSAPGELNGPFQWHAGEPHFRKDLEILFERLRETLAFHRCHAQPVNGGGKKTAREIRAEVEADHFVKACHAYRPPELDVLVDLFVPEERSPWMINIHRLARKGVRIHRLLGDHDDFIEPDHASRLANCLEEVLSATEPATASPCRRRDTRP